MKILILCKVVDNFGDIGFCYRLARSLVAYESSLDVSLSVSDLGSFSKMAGGIKKEESFQVFKGFNVFDWNADEVCRDYFSKNIPDVILECFQCNRPEWLDELLEVSGRIVTILNIDYLTAEDYAEEFHLLKSAIRFPNVKKYFFMDGFTEKTAGLILDGVPETSRLLRADEPKSALSAASKNFVVTIFSYEQDFSPIVKALSHFQKKSEKKVKCRVASGKSEEPFLKAWENEKMPFEIEILPFLQQEEWDEVVYSSDFNFVRGEDSLTRACLSGVPFLWHAYPQDDDYQLVKTEALLNKIFLASDSKKTCATETFRSLFQAYNEAKRTAELSKKIGDELLECLLNYDLLLPFFREFSVRLKKIGNFTENLISFIMKL